MMKYKPDLELAFASRNMASLLYILGYSADEFNSLSIDDVVNLIRDRYVYRHAESENTASQLYIKKQNIVLTRAIRRTWFDVQFSYFEAEKNVR